MNNGVEMKRILDMVESGTISAAEGARLLATTQKAIAGKSIICPYCAEAIPDSAGHCPECGSNLERPAAVQGFGFKALSGLGKFMVIYTLLVSGFNLLNLFFSFGFKALVGVLLSALGLAAGIMIIKSRPGGWGLGILWSALQIVTIVVHGEIINQQVFHLGFNSHMNGQGLGINLIGIVLLILFIKAKPAKSFK